MAESVTASAAAGPAQELKNAPSGESSQEFSRDYSPQKSATIAGLD